MAKDKKNKEFEEFAEEVAEEAAPVVVAPVATPEPEKPRALNVSFDQWCTRRGVKIHHRRGRRAFAGDADRGRPADEWDELFKNY